MCGERELVHKSDLASPGFVHPSILFIHFPHVGGNSYSVIPSAARNRYSRMKLIMTRFTIILWVTLCLSITLLTQHALAEPGIQQRDAVASDRFLDELPACAVSCYAIAKENSSCQSWTENCICLNATQKSFILGCAGDTCPVIEQFQTRNVMDTLCGIAARNLGTLTLVICWVGFLVSGGFVLLRMLAKVTLADNRSPPLACLSPDDGLTMMAYLLSLPCYYIVAFKLIDAGLGRDQWTLSPQQINDFSYWLYVMEPIYLATIWCIKTSFLYLFIRLFATGQSERFCVRGHLKLRHALWGTAIANTLCISSFIITFIFQCTPISFTWTKWQGHAVGTCVNVNAVICAHGALGITFDLWILYMPMSQMSSMNLPGRKKLQVGLMLGIGAIATLASFLRLQGIVTYAASPNATRENYGGTAWSLVEISIGIICTCLPATRLLIIRVIPDAWHRIQGKPPRPPSAQTHATLRPTSTFRPTSVTQPTSGQPRHSRISGFRSKIQKPISTFTRNRSTSKSLGTDTKDGTASFARQPGTADCLVGKAAGSKERPTFLESIKALSVALGRVSDDKPAGLVDGKKGTLAPSGDGGLLGHHPSAAAAPSESSVTLTRRWTPDYFSARISARTAARRAAKAAAKQRALPSEEPKEEPKEPQQEQDQKSVDPVPTPLTPAKPGKATAASMDGTAEGTVGLGLACPRPAHTASDSTVEGTHEPQQAVGPRQRMNPSAHLCLSPLPSTSGWATFGVAESDSPGSSPDPQGVHAHSPLGD
ncbi:hypothetical protein RB594_006311 [Gaeumannomyces avenae]